MKIARMSKEEAERLARRDRNRLIVMAVGVVLLGGAYLFAQYQADRSEERQEDELSARVADDRPTDTETSDDIYVPPFEAEEVLAEIDDSTAPGRETLEPRALEVAFDYARRVSQEATLDAMGMRVLDAAVQQEISSAPAEHRLAPLRVRGRVVAARRRPRDGAPTETEDWIGTLETDDGRSVHFLVARGPVQANGLRSVARGDYLRLDGLFHALYSSPVEREGGFEAVTAPLVLGRDLTPTPPPMTEELARELPALADVEDDSIDDITPPEDFEDAFWQLMGKARLLDGEVDWESAPELSPELLAEMFEDGDDLRGMAVTIPVSINMDTFTRRVGDNPLRLERITEGWIGNTTWKGAVGLVRWYGPFSERGMMREELSNEDDRYVTGRGFFFRNHVYDTSTGQPARAPVLILSDIEVYTIPPDPNAALIGYAVLGGTIGLAGMIFLMLMSDRRKSKALYEDMIRRKRARRARGEGGGAAPGSEGRAPA